MAGLEVVVRPVIFPDIRPRARQSLPPQDDPTKGFAVIKGQPAKSVSLSFSQSVSSSHSKPIETERRVDEARVYQQDDDGTINQDNFVDIEVANRITTKEPAAVSDWPTPLAPVEEKTTYYTRVKPKENVEVKEKDKIIFGA